MRPLAGMARNSASADCRTTDLCNAAAEVSRFAMALYAIGRIFIIGTHMCPAGHRNRHTVLMLVGGGVDGGPGRHGIVALAASPQ